jgi:hypothetical protein
MMTSVINCGPVHRAPKAIEQRFHLMRTTFDTVGAFPLGTAIETAEAFSMGSNMGRKICSQKSGAMGDLRSFLDRHG